jgi:hypothetical protein
MHGSDQVRSYRVGLVNPAAAGAVCCKPHEQDAYPVRLTSVLSLHEFSLAAATLHPSTSPSLHNIPVVIRVWSRASH